MEEASLTRSQQQPAVECDPDRQNLYGVL